MCTELQGNFNLLNSEQSFQFSSTMATRTLESRFERMSVADENEPVDGNKSYKSKVTITILIIVFLS